MPVAVLSRYLLIDTASPTVQVGLIKNGTWQGFCCSDQSALCALFQTIRVCFDQTQTNWRDVDGFIYCQGPGSTLGLRVATMAIKGWRQLPRLHLIPLYAYSSLDAAAAGLLREGIAPPWDIVAGYRSGQWHCLTMSAGKKSYSSTIITSETLKQKTTPCYGLNLGKTRATFPSNVNPLNYDLHDLPAVLHSVLHPQKHPKPFSPNSPQYTRWEKQRHR